MKNIFKAFSIACLMLCVFGFAACGNGDAGDSKGGIKTYTMEAEYIDLSGIQGAGVSGEYDDVSMIVGTGSAADKNKNWSNGYYVACTYSAGLTLNFIFNSDTAASATIILRLGSELGNLTFDSANFAVKLNGAAINYGNVYITNSTLSDMKFFDKTITSNAQLIAGENVISLIVLDNTLRAGQPAGPCVDCVKIKTAANLTWTDKTDNPSRRGEI